MAQITLDGELARDLSTGLSREWLATNGIGGYASGTISGINTRRYHGLLVAAVKPPTRRDALLVRLPMTLRIDEDEYDLSAAEYQDGTIFPEGFRYLSSFSLEDGVPSWSYTVGSFVLRVSLWMVPGHNITVIRCKLAAGDREVELALRPLTAARDHHTLQRVHSAAPFALECLGNGVRLHSGSQCPPLWLLSNGATFTEGGDWYWNFQLREERARGYDYVEDLFQPGTFRARLSPGESVTLIASAEDPAGGLPDVDGALVARRNRAAHGALLPASRAATLDPRLRSLTVMLREAADMFVVRREYPVSPPGGGSSIIAGYPWFTDWGRDSLICLPGILVATGRHAEAISLLRGYGTATSQGMVPNRFADSGEEIEYNSVDASLWYFRALAVVLRAIDPGDARGLLQEVYPRLVDSIAWHRRGTRYGIAMDPADGLLRAGLRATELEPETQLTWMDARYDGVAMTPRIGKPVEVNALWIAAQELMVLWSKELGENPEPYAKGAKKARRSFRARFWNEDRGYLYDVVDAPDGDDPSLRPNQVIALAVCDNLLDRAEIAKVIDAVRDHLLTPFGLRTLSPDHQLYHGVCAGTHSERDRAYHQGTVWPWLMGPYADVFRQVHPEDRSALEALLLPFADHLLEAGIGTISEIFDGDAPHTARGCIAQAWSVGELLRLALSLLD